MCPFWGPTVPEDLACLLFLVFTSQQNMRRSENREIRGLEFSKDVAQLIGRCKILCKIRKPTDKKGWGLVENASLSAKRSASFLLSFTFRNKSEEFSRQTCPHTSQTKWRQQCSRCPFLHFTVSRLWIFLLSNRKAFFKTFPQLKIQRFALSSCTKFMRFFLFLLGSSSRLAFFLSFHFQNLLKTKDSRTVTSWVRLVIRIFCFNKILPSSFAFEFYEQLWTDRRSSKLFDVKKQKPSQVS